MQNGTGHLLNPLYVWDIIDSNSEDPSEDLGGLWDDYYDGLIDAWGEFGFDAFESSSDDDTRGPLKRSRSEAFGTEPDQPLIKKNKF